ncbi:MAG: histidinol dehydrogenase [Lachnospiraceae bacterium]|nr:histidinol dehydrogenase [Lachnospiraceae bacterium]
MNRYNLNEDTKKEILTRLAARSPNDDLSAAGTAAEILEQIRTRGDEALFEYTKRFDGWDVSADNIRVTEDEIEEACAAVGERLMSIFAHAAANIRSYHENQVRKDWYVDRPAGSVLGQRITPLARAGVYVPGGKAAYPSTALMNMIPAKVAGVPRVVMTTPAGKDGKVSPYTLAAAKVAGVTEIYKIGGAQAIAALAYGTETVPKVDKITGPGNIFVAAAKKLVFGHVSIDSIAGPSEILVLADETADPRYVAADLLSQAEHDERASAILITDSEKLTDAVESELERFIAKLPRTQIIQASVRDHGYIIIAPDMKAGCEMADLIASEHVEIMTADPKATMADVHNAGAIFLGSWSCEPLGDYFAGPNHVLPTNGTAKFFSPLSVDDFIKKTSVICYTEDALRAVHDEIEEFAHCEQLDAHANAIHVRFENE